MIYKVNEGRPHVVDRIRSRGIDLIVNTPLGEASFYDDGAIRKNAILNGVLCLTTLTAAAATVEAIRALRERSTIEVTSLQEIHAAGGCGSAVAKGDTARTADAAVGVGP
jgi:carbamoyl-phosphate synthase large subunit